MKYSNIYINASLHPHFLKLPVNFLFFLIINIKYDLKHYSIKYSIILYLYFNASISLYVSGNFNRLY